MLEKVLGVNDDRDCLTVVVAAGSVDVAWWAGIKGLTVVGNRIINWLRYREIYDFIVSQVFVKGLYQIIIDEAKSHEESKDTTSMSDRSFLELYLTFKIAKEVASNLSVI